MLGTKEKKQTRIKYCEIAIVARRSYKEKTLQKLQGFLKIWSAREDSNLRPTGPKPVALPGCATRRK
jgi:hypothetical protein